MPTPVEQIKEQLDLVDVVSGYVKLDKAGKDYKGLCPFHSEKTPSFFVSPEKQVWHCFGCSEGGDLFTFIQEMEGLEFRDTLNLLAERAGVDLTEERSSDHRERERLLAVTEAAASLYESTLHERDADDRVWRYLRERGVTPELARTFNIGFAPNAWTTFLDYSAAHDLKPQDAVRAGLLVAKDNGDYYDRFRGRIIFPIHDVHGTVIGFSGRILPWVASSEEEQGRTPGKYINTPNTPLYDKSRAIYGLHQARTAMRKSDVALLVEGQMDVVLAHAVGFRQAVAASGTALTSDHLRTIKRYTERAVLAFDMDEAGEKAARRALEAATGLGMDIKIAVLPDGMDPADCALKDPDTLGTALQGAREGIAFFLERAVKHHDTTTARGKRAVMAAVVPLFHRMEGGVEKAHWVREVADRIGSDERAVREELERFQRNQQQEQQSQRSSQHSNQRSPRKRRSRTALLEEYLCGLVVQFPDLQAVLDREEVRNIFTTNPVRGIMEVVAQRQPIVLRDLQEELPHDQRTFVARLAFRVEKRIPDTEAAQREFATVMGDLKQARLREELAEIGRALRAAERAGDAERVANLQDTFTRRSDELRNLTS